MEGAMRVLVIGATGYLGGAVSLHLKRRGHDVSGLVRDRSKEGRLREAGVSVVGGSLEDAAVLAGGVSEADAVINAADSDHAAGVDSLLTAISGTGKTLIHTSGISVTADRAAGASGGAILDEITPFEPIPERAARFALD